MNNQIDIRLVKSKQKRNNGSGHKKNTTKADHKDFWGFLNKDIKLFSSGVNDRIKENFYLELATLLEAGMDIRTILEMVAFDQKSKKVKLVFNQLLDDITKGASLSAALDKAGKFSKYEYYSILIGEESGKLVEVLKDLALYFQKKIKQKRQVIGALTYPIVVLTVAFLAVSFMVGYVVPMFSDVFKRFGSDLPVVTKWVIAASDLFKTSIMYVLFSFSGVIVFAFSQKEKSWFRKSAAALLLKLPVLGNIVHKIYLSRFANTLALLSSAKVSLIQSLELTQKMITFFPIENALNTVKEKIAEGKPFNESLQEHSIFPSKMIAFVKVGEQVNQLELFFNRIADQYSTEVEYQTGMLSKLLEPIIIVVLGAVVAVILVAMYLPMFKLGQPM